MSVFLIIHKLALILLVLTGILCLFPIKNKIKNIHGLVAFITIFTIFIYLIQSSYNSVGYIVYGLLLISTYMVAKFVKHKNSIWGHISIFVFSVLWLIMIHVV